MIPATDRSRREAITSVLNDNRGANSSARDTGKQQFKGQTQADNSPREDTGRQQSKRQTGRQQYKGQIQTDSSARDRHRQTAVQRTAPGRQQCKRRHRHATMQGT